MKGFHKLIFIFLIVLLISAGFFIAFYPKLSNKANSKKKEEIMIAIEEGKEIIEIKLPKDYGDADIYDTDFNKGFHPLITPVPSASPLDDESVNKVHGIGIIAIETIDLKLPIIEGVDGGKLKIAIGHIPGSALIGEVGNCIIVGHRNYTYGEMFNRMNEVDVGDIIKLALVNGNVYEYKVCSTTVIEPGDDRLFEYDVGQRKLTLLTCTPIRKATHRLLVQAELME